MYAPTAGVCFPGCSDYQMCFKPGAFPPHSWVARWKPGRWGGQIEEAQMFMEQFGDSYGRNSGARKREESIQSSPDPLILMKQWIPVHAVQSLSLIHI